MFTKALPLLRKEALIWEHLHENVVREKVQLKVELKLACRRHDKNSSKYIQIVIPCVINSRWHV